MFFQFDFWQFDFWQLFQLSIVNNFSGWMAVFDVDDAQDWDKKLYTRDEAFNGKTIHVVGL